MDTSVLDINLYPIYQHILSHPNTKEYKYAHVSIKQNKHLKMDKALQFILTDRKLGREEAEGVLD